MKLRYLTAVKLINQRCPTHETGCGAHTIRDQDLGQKYLQKMLDTKVVVQSYTLLARAKIGLYDGAYTSCNEQWKVKDNY